MCGETKRTCLFHDWVLRCSRLFRVIALPHIAQHPVLMLTLRESVWGTKEVILTIVFLHFPIPVCSKLSNAVWKTFDVFVFYSLVAARPHVYTDSPERMARNREDHNDVQPIFAHSYTAKCRCVLELNNTVRSCNWTCNVSAKCIIC